MEDIISLKIQENPDNNKDEEEVKYNENEKIHENDSITFSKIFQKEPNNNPKYDEKENLFSTKIFMKSIDLRCEDHLTKFQEDIEATRFCEKCKILCCDACVIDYHIEHISSAKKKVEDYFLSQKNHITELNNKIQESIKYKINEKEIDKIVLEQKKIIEDFFQRRKDEIDITKKKLENILNFEKELKEKMIKAIETFYKDECYKRLKVPIENNERLGNKIERFIKDWAKFNKREKVTVLKNNVISEFDIESTSNINQIKEEMVNFKGKSLDIQKKINGLLETIGKNDKFNDLDKIYSEMNENYLNIMKDIGDLKYDKLTIQKIQDIKNKNAEMDYNFKELLNDKMYNINNNVNMNMNNGINNQQQPYLQPQHPQMPSQNLPQFNQNNQEPFAQSVNIVNQEYSKRMSENFNLFNNEKNSQMMNSLNIY